MKYIKLCVILGTLFGVVGCATPQAKVGFDSNKEIDTQHYKTFSWLTVDKILIPSADLNPVMKVRVDEAIEAAFIAKGYQFVSDVEKADFTISYTVGNREALKVHNYPVAYSSRFRWGGSYHRGHYNEVVINDSYVSQYTEGKLAIDIYDVKAHQPVWHGWATKRLSTADKASPTETMNTIIAQILSQF